MGIVAAVCGAWRVVAPGGGGGSRRADLVLWVSAPGHREIYAGTPEGGAGRSLVEQFRERTGRRVSVDLMSTRAVDVRLLSLLMSGSGDVPDVVELEIGSVAKYFRPPVDQVGLLPLNEFLKESGWLGEVSAARLKLWSKDGVIFGVPHDVHPVTITYRKDLFDEAGVDLEKAATWPAFREACLAFQAYWAGRGVRRHAMEFADASGDHLIPMLLQRGLNPIDERGEIRMTEDRFIETVAFYVECLAGPTKMSSLSGAGVGGLARDLVEGNICAVMTADWRVDVLKQFAPGLAGKVRMMPLPVFEAGDARTSTWGGTMIGIPRRAKDPRASWRLIEWLYFSKEGLAAQRARSSILPAVRSGWVERADAAGDAFFGGQRVDALYAEMAREVPARFATPATSMAYAYLSKVIVDGRNYVAAHPGDRAGLEREIRGWLARMAADLRRRVEHARFEE